MRIVGGKYKGRKLSDFDFDNIRPTSDMVRESVFDILQNRIEGASFVDLFCGSGAMGIEAISRGANSVIFNDFSRDSLSVLKTNLKFVEEKEKYEITNFDADAFIDRVNGFYDIIYIDPPYKSGLSYKTCIKAENILKDDGIIICENETPYNNECDDFLYMYDERKYGRVYITFFKKKKEACVFAGSFDPVTIGHSEIVKECVRCYKKVFIAIGNNDQKVPTFSLEDRVKMLHLSFDKYKNIKIEHFDGLLVDFMKKNNIFVTVRGIRNNIDLAYENNMKNNNEKLNSDIKTEYIFVKGNVKNISSTDAKMYLNDDKKLKKYLDKNIIDYIRKI